MKTTFKESLAFTVLFLLMPCLLLGLLAGCATHPTTEAKLQSLHHGQFTPLSRTAQRPVE